jgi:hypothetical protein
VTAISEIALLELKYHLHEMAKSPRKKSSWILIVVISGLEGNKILSMHWF